MKSFIHISDLHIDRQEDKNRYLSSKLIALKKRFPFSEVIVTGDITDDGTIDQYQQAARLLFPFKGHIFLAPGNHDYGIAGNFYNKKCIERYRYLCIFLGAPYPRLDKTLTGTYDKRPTKISLQYQQFKINLIGLDSCLRTKNPFDFARGGIGFLQRILLKLAFGLSRQGTSICYFHHHPFLRSPFSAMKDADSVLEILPRADIVLFGHRHVDQLFHTKLGVRWISAAGKFEDVELVREFIVDNGNIHVESHYL